MRSARCQPTAFLSLRELESLTCARLTGFLPLHRASVPCEEPVLAQLPPVRVIRSEQRPGNGEPQSTCLPGEPTAGHTRPDVERPERVGHGERLLNVLNQRAAWEVIPQGSPVHVPLTRAWCEVYPGPRCLAPSDRVPPQLLFHWRRHRSCPSSARSAWVAAPHAGGSLRRKRAASCGAPGGSRCSSGACRRPLSR